MKKALISLLLCAGVGLSLAASPALQCDDESTMVKTHNKQVRKKSLSSVQQLSTSVAIDRDNNVISDPKPIEPGPHGKTVPLPGKISEFMSPNNGPTLRVKRVLKLDKKVSLTQVKIVELVGNTLEPEGVGKQPRPIKPGKSIGGSGGTIRDSLVDALQKALTDGTVKRAEPMQAPQVKSGPDLKPVMHGRGNQVVNDPQPIEPGNHPHGGGGKNLFDFATE